MLLNLHIHLREQIQLGNDTIELLSDPKSSLLSTLDLFKINLNPQNMDKIKEGYILDVDQFMIDYPFLKQVGAIFIASYVRPDTKIPILVKNHYYEPKSAWVYAQRSKIEKPISDVALEIDLRLDQIENPEELCNGIDKFIVKLKEDPRYTFKRDSSRDQSNEVISFQIYFNMSRLEKFSDYGLKDMFQFDLDAFFKDTLGDENNELNELIEIECVAVFVNYDRIYVIGKAGNSFQETDYNQQFGFGCEDEPSISIEMMNLHYGYYANHERESTEHILKRTKCAKLLKSFHSKIKNGDDDYKLSEYSENNENSLVDLEFELLR